MLGKVAGGIYWMFRYLERSENIARLIEAGLRIALTRGGKAADEWRSLIETVGMREAYEAKYENDYSAQRVVDFMLRGKDDHCSVACMIEQARNNGRMSRASMTREVWEALNDCYYAVKEAFRHPIPQSELPNALGLVRQHSALVRGALHGTMLRNDIYDFSRLGTFIERADNTARILDVKYYTLLPHASFVGSSLDNVQWETVLRSVSAHRSFRWLGESEMTASAIADFLILDRRLPRSLSFCAKQISNNLGYLAEDYGERHKCHDMADKLRKRLKGRTINSIFDEGLHEFITGFIYDNNALGLQIERDFRFSG